MLKIVIGVLAASALLAVAGCGGKSAAEKEKEGSGGEWQWPRHDHL